MDHPAIDPAIRTRIEAELEAIERQHRIAILFAVESGSRAWGFPSQDSDYDVRFVYLHPIEHYLAVSPRRDVIERPVDTTLDVSGWDLRKALYLLVGSNAVLIEWLTSPVRYRCQGTALARILDLALSTANVTALAYHYAGLCRKSFESIQAGTGTVRLKTYCYALRTALALTWLAHHREAPPMDLPSLMAGARLPDGMADRILDLVARKRCATEHDAIPRDPTLDDIIGGALDLSILHGAAVARGESVARADALFASLVLERPA